MSELLRAVFANDVKTVKALCESIGAVSAINTARKEDQCYPIHAAVTRGSHTILELLIANGAIIDAKHGSGSTALILAAQDGKLKCAELLIESKAELDAKTNSGVTALYVACQAGHLRIVNLLIAAGCNVDLPLPNGATAIIVAAQKGHVDCVTALVQKGRANPNVTFQKLSLLEHAILRGKEDVAAALIALGARIPEEEPLFLPTQKATPEKAKKGGFVDMDKGDVASMLLLEAGDQKEPKKKSSMGNAGKKVDEKQLEELLRQHEKRYVEELAALRAQLEQQKLVIATWRTAFVALMKDRAK